MSYISSKVHHKIATCDKSDNPSWPLVFRCRFCDSALSPCSVMVHSIQILTKCTTQPYRVSQLSACNNYRTVWGKVLKAALPNLQVVCYGWVLPVILNSPTAYICMVQQCSAYTILRHMDNVGAGTVTLEGEEQLNWHDVTSLKIRIFTREKQK
jgi:hypothetical protein